MNEDAPRSTFLGIVISTGLIAPVFAAVVIAVSWAISAQESAVGVFQDSREGYFETKEQADEWMVFWLCRELDTLRESNQQRLEVLRSDIRELRNWLWAALGAGGGGLGTWGYSKLKRNGKAKQGPSQSTTS